MRFDQLHRHLILDASIPERKKVTGSHLSWTKEQAEAFLKKHEVIFKKTGFEPVIVGSVAKKGRSDHDLDVLLKFTGDEFSEDEDIGNPDTLADYPEWKYLRSDGVSMLAVQLPDKRVIDFWFGDEDEEDLDESISDETSFPKTMTMREMRQWILDNKLRDSSGRIDDNTASHLSGGASEWVLKKIAVADLPGDSSIPPRKKKRDNLPIIVTGAPDYYDVIDGRHRVAEARHNGEKYIWAYVDAEEHG